MTKKSNLAQSEIRHRLQNLLPGEASSDSLVEPPETSIYFTNIGRDSLQEFHRYSTNEKLYEFLEFSVFKNEDDTEAYYEKMEKRMNDQKSHYYWFVRLKKNDKLRNIKVDFCAEAKTFKFSFTDQKKKLITVFAER